MDGSFERDVSDIPFKELSHKSPTLHEKTCSNVSWSCLQKGHNRFCAYLKKSSKYFLNLEKWNKAKSHLRTLLSDSGDECTNPTEIMSKALFTRVRYRTVPLRSVPKSGTERGCVHMGRKKIKRSVPKQVQKLGGTEK